MDSQVANMMRESIESIAETQAHIHKDLAEMKQIMVQQSNHTFSVASEIKSLNRNLIEIIEILKKNQKNE